MGIKKILVVNSILENLKDEDKVFFKSNKTIIKNASMLEDNSFVEQLKIQNIEYRWLLEEWEIINDNKINIICSNNGNPIHPIHIVDNPKNGAKALFQCDKLLLIRIFMTPYRDNDFKTYTLSKYQINDEGFIKYIKILEEKYENFEDIKNTIPEHFKYIIDNLIVNYDKLKLNYSEPLFCLKI